MNRIGFYFSCLFLALGVVGCANVQLANDIESRKAKLFQPPQKGQASVYLLRDSHRGQTSVLELSINGITVAKTAPNTFVHFSLPEGRYYIGSRGENYSQFVLNAESENHYFIRQVVTIGWNDFRTELVALSNAEGKEAVIGSSMAIKLVEDGDLLPISRPK